MAASSYPLAHWNWRSALERARRNPESFPNAPSTTEKSISRKPRRSWISSAPAPRSPSAPLPNNSRADSATRFWLSVAMSSISWFTSRLGLIFPRKGSTQLLGVSSLKKSPPPWPAHRGFSTQPTTAASSVKVFVSRLPVFRMPVNRASSTGSSAWIAPSSTNNRAQPETRSRRPPACAAFFSASPIRPASGKP